MTGGFSLGTVWAKIDADISSFKAKVESASKDIKSFGTTAKGYLKDVNKAAIVASAAIAGVTFAGFKLAETAGQYESIRDSFQSMTKDMGINVSDFEKRVANASANTIDRLTILQGGTRALSLIGKDSFKDFGKEFEEMAMLSKKAARATGQDVDFMFNSLILGVSRSSKLILDNLGINVSIEEANAKYAASLGKTTEELSAQEQKAALLKGALEALHTNYDEVAVTSGGFQGAMQQLNTQLTNAKIEIGTALIPVFNDLVRSITPLIKEYLPPLIQFITNAVNWFRSLSPEIQKGTFVFLALIPVVLAVTAGLLALGPVIALLLNPITWLVAGVILLANTFYERFMLIKNTWDQAPGWFKSLLSGIVSIIKAVGGQILDSLVQPFEDAWNKIKDLANKIKDKLDFTKRHSPSVLDIVNMGVKKVNRAFENLDFNINASTPQIASSVSPVGGGGIVNVNVSLDGAVIADEYSAGRISELIGDNIIKRVQSSIRI